MRGINFFRTQSGECPVEKFLDTLTPKQAQKVTWVMQLIEELARIPEQYFKKLVNTDGIWEIRIQLGSNIFRILGFFNDKNNFIATNGFQKKTQKTPKDEIQLAEKRKSEYSRNEVTL
jgi:phage-related protein